MAKVLTAKAVEALKPVPGKRLEVPDAAFPGLYLLVQPSGARSWAYRYRHGTKPKKLTLGAYPRLGLAEARTAARAAAQTVALGVDPAAAKAAAKADAKSAEASGRDKVRTLLDTFDKRHLSTIKSGRQVRQFLDRSILAAWGDRDIQTIAKRDVIELLDKIVDAGTPTTANRVLAHTRKFFNWCVERDVLDRAPTHGVKAPAKERTRDRVLSDDEIRWLWRATEAEGQPFGPLARLLLLTGQRLGEGVGLTDFEISGGVWHLSASRTKNGRAHDVPLSEAALEVLAGVKRITASPRQWGNGRSAAAELQPSRKLVFTTTGKTPVSGYDRAVKRLRARVEAAATEEKAAAVGLPVEAVEPVTVPPWGFHDLRRTAATGMARLGFPVQVVEAVLNHASGAVSGVAAIYNRHDYAVEKRAALEAWASYLDRLTGNRPANVVVLEEART